MKGSDIIGRRDLLRGTLAVGGLVGLSACSTTPRASLAAVAPPLPTRLPMLRRPPLVPFRVGVEELVDVKACLRPFRAAGPNLNAEQVGDKLVVHNYGHGGSGWSLSWGSAEVVVGKVLSVTPGDVAVIGCGVVGLTAAVHAQRAGLKVTIYAREPFARTRSVRATGTWSPDSRIALTEPAGPQFGALWEHMARISWKAFRSYVGLPGAPVDFGDQYALSDTPAKPREVAPLDPTLGTFSTTGAPQQNAEFAKYDDRIRDIVPQAYDLAPEDNPFGTPHARFSSHMFFNFSSYGHLLMQQFLEAGGKFEIRDFHRPSDIAQLKEKVVINATGFAAKALWDDKTMFPVRGQNGWLTAQPESNYSVSYRGVSLFSKADGVRVSAAPSGLGNMYGVNDGNEVPDFSEIETGLRMIAPLLARMENRA
ncbi:FAD-dependent oxidoreductase [Rhizorhabdus sp. FW153]|uniref:FAD-dependent oxidoreductase n=1 Tax=Rhizorhabdus sp. FW153 TaxID=3400216 RepID=UPI003CFAB9D5